MKKTILALAFIAASLSTSSAATLIADNYSSGLTLANGTTPLANGRIRFGTFVITNTDIINNQNNLTFLNNNFREVVNYSGAINAFSTPGFFDNAILGSSATYAGGSTLYGGTTYDLSTGTTSNVANDIAGSNIYMWVLDNAVLNSATQQGIFASNYIWADSDLLPSNDSAFDMQPSAITALVGQVASGNDIGAGAASHRLAVVIPEPSRALLMFLGLGGFILRRRRA